MTAAILASLSRPYAREVPFVDPISAFAAFADDPFAVFLDSADPGRGRGRYSYIAVEPLDVVVWNGAASDPFAAIRHALGPARAESDVELPPFQGGVCGVMGYELGRVIERLPDPKGTAHFPDLAFGLFDTIIAFDMVAKRTWIIAQEMSQSTSPIVDRLNRWVEYLARVEGLAPVAMAPAENGVWQWELGRSEFTAAVQRAVDYIYAGDIFQANITTRAAAALTENPFALYRRLRALSPAPFAAFVRCSGSKALISASPERFLSVHADGQISTRPIKGTRPRADTPEEDAVNAVELTESTKDRAENLMIVDLLRNDISRVAEIGSVDVTALYELETFANVHHLVSEVTGRLQPDRDAIDLLRAAFPGGSITGAPKVRAMEIIHEIEASRRGPYCGSVFWAGFDGALDSSIVIRSLVASGDVVYAHAGGGIVADSDPQSEYEEMRLKAAALLRAVMDDPA